ncbi:hypothetical protein B0H13DRAFT_2398658 [Mycena leptocephala]|nr:hypothetical protein B0H13DRAFT_2398658 [Mycena leptocephala]
MHFNLSFLAAALLVCTSPAMSATVIAFAGADCTGAQTARNWSPDLSHEGGGSARSWSYSGVPTRSNSSSPAVPTIIVMGRHLLPVELGLDVSLRLRISESWFYGALYPNTTAYSAAIPIVTLVDRVTRGQREN